jgi:hypothetical protein
MSGACDEHVPHSGTNTLTMFYTPRDSAGIETRRVPIHARLARIQHELVSGVCDGRNNNPRHRVRTREQHKHSSNVHIYSHSSASHGRSTLGAGGRALDSKSREQWQYLTPGSIQLSLAVSSRTFHVGGQGRFSFPAQISSSVSLIFTELQRSSNPRFQGLNVDCRVLQSRSFRSMEFARHSTPTHSTPTHFTINNITYPS